MNELEELFLLQIKFQKLIGNTFPRWKDDITNEHNVELIKNQILALYDEVGEALREVPWKPWKINQQFNVKKFRVELIDVFHFLINLFLLSGMDVQETIELFKWKNNMNKKRQKDGY